jgi:omega-6 fatty acid desaturase (delta-12 desaturase)
MIQSYSQNAADESNIINTLKNWPELVKKYTEASLQKSLTQIANTFIPFFALWIISYFLMDISKALAILICIINAFFL